MNNYSDKEVKKKSHFIFPEQSKIISKSTFNDPHRISTIPKGTIVPASEDNPGINLRELLNQIKAKRLEPIEEQENK